MATLEYNVRDYGAYPDSGKDETANIKACIDAALNTGTAVQDGGTVIIPSGAYLIQGVLLDPTISSTWYNPKLTIRGDMPAAAGASGQGTRLILMNDYTSDPIFKIHGDGGSNWATGFELSQITLDGNGKACPKWLSFVQASYTRLERVQIVNTLGRGIYGENWADSVCHDMIFDNVGDETNTYASMELRRTSGASDACKNLTFEALRFANNKYFATWVRTDSTCIRFLGCSWFGDPSTSGGVPLYQHSNVQLAGAFQCSFTGCCFQKSGDDHIAADSNTNGMLVTTSTFQDAYGYGISMAGGYNIITENSFATTSGSAANTAGNINDTGTGNVNSKNTGGSGAIL